MKRKCEVFFVAMFLFGFLVVHSAQGKESSNEYYAENGGPNIEMELFAELSLSDGSGYESGKKFIIHNTKKVTRVLGRWSTDVPCEIGRIFSFYIIFAVPKDDDGNHVLAKKEIHIIAMREYDYECDKSLRNDIFVKHSPEYFAKGIIDKEFITDGTHSDSWLETHPLLTKKVFELHVITAFLKTL